MPLRRTPEFRDCANKLLTSSDSRAQRTDKRLLTHGGEKNAAGGRALDELRTVQLETRQTRCSEPGASVDVARDQTFSARGDRLLGCLLCASPRLFRRLSRVTGFAAQRKAPSYHLLGVEESAVCPVFADTLTHIARMYPRLNTVEPCHADEDAKHGGRRPTCIRAGEQPVLAAQGHWEGLTFIGVVVDFDATVAHTPVQSHLSPHAAGRRVSQLRPAES
jgi:hypothetical protein